MFDATNMVSFSAHTFHVNPVGIIKIDCQMLNNKQVSILTVNEHVDTLPSHSHTYLYVNLVKLLTFCINQV